MSPELSIIILTVLAGVGQGLFIFLVTGDLISAIRGTRIENNTIIAGVVVALLFTTAGVAASFFHLTHKARGVKAIKQWKSSWLSREVILLPLFQGLTVLYAASLFIGASTEIRMLIGALGVIAALALYLASGMIYAEVRFVKEWGTLFTPLNFILIGLATGGVAAIVVFEFSGAAPSLTLSILRAVFGVIVLGLLVKLVYYRRNSMLYSPFSIQSAIGVNHPDIRLADMGVSYDHYNTIEYNYGGFKGSRSMIRIISIVLLFIVPIVILSLDYMPLFRGEPAGLALVAVLLMIPGALMERWLFFADGNHAQNLYYGNFIDKGALNPLLQSGKAQAPLPEK